MTFDIIGDWRVAFATEKTKDKKQAAFWKISNKDNKYEYCGFSTIEYSFKWSIKDFDWCEVTSQNHKW